MHETHFSVEKHSPLVPEQGSLKWECTLHLHTAQARQLFYGSWKPTKYGFIQFVQTLNMLFKGYTKGDPYAEYYLVKIDDLLVETQEKLKTVENRLHAIKDSLKGLEIKIYTAPQPAQYPLVFRYPPAYMGARLLGETDYLLRYALTLKKLGIYLESSDFDFKRLNHMLRELYEFPAQWKNTGVVREDVMNNTPIAQKAKAAMGTLPQAILEGKISLSYLKSP